MKKKIILCAVLAVLLAGIIASLYIFLDIQVIGDEDYYQTVYDTYSDGGARATLFGRELNNVVTESDVDTGKFGDYTVRYSTSFAFFHKEAERHVHVIDDKKPSITLKGNSECFVSVNGEYKEMGYEATDNYDGDISGKVTVSGSVDTAKEGTYEIKYSVSDSSGNKREVTRKVEVKPNKGLSAYVSEFWLADYFPDIILYPEEKENGYFDEEVLLGDSNTWFLFQWSHLIKAEQCWGKRNLNMTEINSSTFFNFTDGKERTLKESIETFKPRYLIINPGIGSPLFMRDTEKYVNELEACIDYLRNEHPEITFVFSAILPINDGQLSREFQSQINVYNYLLAEVCHNHKVYLINFSDTIRGKDGYAITSKMVYNMEDINDQGFHLSEETRKDYIDYLKHIDIRRTVE